MKLTLERITYSEEATIGRLFLDNEYYCYTLEDTVRPAGVKVYGKTAIPAGTYKVIVNQSTRFKKLLPLLLDVPGFEGIRIHGGNTADDSLGCILVAKELISPTMIRGSMSDDLTKKLIGEEHTIEIIDTIEVE